MTLREFLEVTKNINLDAEIMVSDHSETTNFATDIEVIEHDQFDKYDIYSYVSFNYDPKAVTHILIRSA